MSGLKEIGLLLLALKEGPHPGEKQEIKESNHDGVNFFIILGVDHLTI